MLHSLQLVFPFVVRLRGKVAFGGMPRTCGILFPAFAGKSWYQVAQFGVVPRAHGQFDMGFCGCVLLVRAGLSSFPRLRVVVSR